MIDNTIFFQSFLTEKHPRMDQLIRGNKRKEPTSERKTNKESRISKMKKFKKFVDIVFKNAN